MLETLPSLPGPPAPAPVRVWPPTAGAPGSETLSDVDGVVAGPARVVLVGLCDLASHGLEAVLSQHPLTAVLLDAEAGEVIDVDLVLHAGGRSRSLDPWRSHQSRPRLVLCGWGPAYGASPGGGHRLDLSLPVSDLVARLVALRSCLPTDEPVADQQESVGPGSDGVGLVGQAGLGPREAQVLELIGQGLSNAEITARLHVSINTVKTYIRTGYHKIGVSSRTQAALWVVAARATTP
ncbi:helix-turn-helix transcriptional regulator [Nocardioides nanhaiensis]|uniref:Response regulator transcription factor n=1 Tax=Nocardioides nanhaiensis TaxID=1476871 RepID=A0ABP8VUR9_9ACTN